MIRRREFIAMMSSAAAWPLAARAQQRERVRRLALLANIAETDPEAQAMVGALQRGLEELGWVEGRNLSIDRRWGAGNLERVEFFAKELVAAQPEAIVAYTTPAVLALRQETSSIPIVFVQISDPVGAGFVTNMAHPGGNITGFTNFESSMGGKWAEMLKEIAPQTSRVAFLFNPDTAPYVRRYYLGPFEAAARSLGMQPSTTPLQETADIETAIASFAREPGGALVLLPDSFNIVHRARFVALASRHLLPAISPYRFMVKEGGLMSYGVDQVDLFRRAATYVDRLLKGEKPADLPVQAPTKFELVINLNTAKALDLSVPDKLLALADEVIE